MAEDVEDLVAVRLRHLFSSRCAGGNGANKREHPVGLRDSLQSPREAIEIIIDHARLRARDPGQMGEQSRAAEQVDEDSVGRILGHDLREPSGEPALLAHERERRREITFAAAGHDFYPPPICK